MREFEDAEVDFGEDGGDVVADVGNNADVYAANQERSTMKRTWRRLRYASWVKMYFTISRLVLTKRR